MAQKKKQTAKKHKHKKPTPPGGVDTYKYSGNHGPIHKGYYVKLPDVDPEYNQPSAYLVDLTTNRRLHLWVSEVTASFSVGGSYAQTVNQRRWYPRNFTDATFTILGQMPNSYQYQRLAEFVRASQIHALNDVNGKSPLRLIIPKAGKDYKRAVKGSRDGYNFDGFILSMDRGAERFVNAPTFQFDFVVQEVNVGTRINGLFESEQAAVADKVMNWSHFLSKSGLESDFSADPTPTPKKAKNGTHGTHHKKHGGGIVDTIARDLGEFFGFVGSLF